MNLNAGDWVRTDAGEVGRVVDVAKLTVFVEVMPPSRDTYVKAFLISQLTKIKPPGDQNNNPPSTH